MVLALKSLQTNAIQTSTCYDRYTYGTKWKHVGGDYLRTSVWIALGGVIMSKELKHGHLSLSSRAGTGKYDP